jgi:hypothetical protein
MIAGTRRTHVTILKYEGEEHCEQTMTGMLTQFFLDKNNINTAVSTYVIKNGLADNDDLELENVQVLDDGFYSKQICTLSYFVHLNQSCDPDFQFPVMFVFAHGEPMNELHEEPTLLNFSPHDDPPVVHASRVTEDGLCLNDLMTHSKLVILCCCHDDELLQGYLAEQGNDIPDICFYDYHRLHVVTHAIFVAWLIKVMDSNGAIRKNPSLDALYLGARHSVRSILFQIQQCDDTQDLCHHLLLWGCISKYAQEKARERQDLPHGRNRGLEPADFANFYRVFGHTRNVWMLPDTLDIVFREFRALTLVSPGPGAPVKLTYLSEFPATEQLHPRAPKSSTPPAPQDHIPPSPQPHTDIALLLSQSPSSHTRLETRKPRQPHAARARSRARRAGSTRNAGGAREGGKEVRRGGRAGGVSAGRVVSAGRGGLFSLSCSSVSSASLPLASLASLSPSALCHESNASGESGSKGARGS